jgi:hypothetical protein
MKRGISWRAFLLIPLVIAYCALPSASQALLPPPPPDVGYPEGLIYSPPSWSAGPDLPSAGVRFAGVYFPPDGKFTQWGAQLGRSRLRVATSQPILTASAAFGWQAATTALSPHWLHGNLLQCRQRNSNANSDSDCDGYSYSPETYTIATAPSGSGTAPIATRWGKILIRSSQTSVAYLLVRWCDYSHSGRAQLTLPY